jgi:hypothetical protein
MEPQVRTSFIPKQAIQVERKRPKGDSAALVTIIAALLFLGSVVAAGGVFLFEQYLKQSIVAKSESLERSRAAFEPAVIKELARTDSRITAAAELLSGHTSLSRLFSYLGTNTLASVRFLDLNYERVGPGRTTLIMNGTAKSYSAVALQSDIFGKSDVIEEPIFSDLNLDTVGNVVFKFEGVVNTTEIKYLPLVGREPSQTLPVTAPTSTPTNQVPPSTAAPAI